MKNVKPYKVLGAGKCWNVVEQATEQTIVQLPTSRDAKRRANFLNGGNGFNGWTPPFFLRGLA